MSVVKSEYHRHVTWGPKHAQWYVEYDGSVDDAAVQQSLNLQIKDGDKELFLTEIMELWHAVKDWKV